MVGKILRNTAIGGVPVAKDEIVEVDDHTFATLRRCGKIVEHVSDDEEEDAPKQPVKPKFKVKTPAAAKTE